MSNAIRIPPFLREEFHNLKTKEEKDQFLLSYRNWKASAYTELLDKYLEEKLKGLITEEEKEDTFFTLFQMKYKSAHNKGSRRAIREIRKAI